MVQRGFLVLLEAAACQLKNFLLLFVQVMRHQVLKLLSVSEPVAGAIVGVVQQFDQLVDLMMLRHAVARFFLG
ncbi:hypothetical protein DK37_22310 [Halomonas sp. SUBG004]|nr:hypothetical protein DK37_22310 [Halomonas sp. SUBG004]